MYPFSSENRRSFDKTKRDVPTEESEDVELALERLPEELAERCRMIFDSQPAVYATAEKKLAHIKKIADYRVGKIIDERKITINERFTDKEEIVKQCVNAMKEVNEVLGKPEFKMGSGKTATVFHLKDEPTMCVKVIHSQKEYLEQRRTNHGNTIDREIEILRSLEGMRLNKVRVPEFYFQLPPGIKEGFVMQAFDAIEMYEVFRQDRQEIIDRLDIDAFVDAIVEFAKALHAMDLIHMDLHQGNIMIDPVTLDPRVIDFGRAHNLSTMEPDLRERMLKMEFEHLENLRRDLHARKR